MSPMYLRGCGAFFGVLFSLAALCQPGQGFSRLMNCYKPAERAEEISFGLFVKNLEHEKYKNDVAFLRTIVTRAHHTYLKHFKALAQFPDLFGSGEFDCLTGTSLISLVLDHFGFRYSVVETNYHIFLIVHTNQGDALVESTDKANAIVMSGKTIEQRVGQYRQNVLSYQKQNVYHYHFSLFQEITSSQLPGLLFFNQAIKSFNNGDWEACANFIERAQEIYTSPRMGELSALLIKTVAMKEPDAERRQIIIARLQQHLSRTVAGL